MATKPIERLIFAQGGKCFFCEEPLPRDQASVEHLVAQAHGGRSNDENCVATCKSLNSLFGRMSLKEKLKIIINQQGNFLCPNRIAPQLKSADVPVQVQPQPPEKKPISRQTNRSQNERLDLVIKDLKRRGNSRPGKLDKLENTIRAYLLQLGETPREVQSIMQELQSRSYVSVENKKVKYKLP